MAVLAGSIPLSMTAQPPRNRVSGAALAALAVRLWLFQWVLLVLWAVSVPPLIGSTPSRRLSSLLLGDQAVLVREARLQGVLATRLCYRNICCTAISYPRTPQVVRVVPQRRRVAVAVVVVRVVLGVLVMSLRYSESRLPRLR